MRSQPILFEILPKGVNKATGLKALAGREYQGKRSWLSAMRTTILK
ncbi:MAG: hypothetical protein ACLRSL_04935 [Streptococcus sp.]